MATGISPEEMPKELTTRDKSTVSLSDFNGGL
jgi:hypothetical protein